MEQKKIQNIKTPLKIKINNIRPKFFFKYTISTSEGCGICQTEFESTCGSCKHPTECLPVKGECNHCFHGHCLVNWVKVNGNCPICRSLWKEVAN